ncbi:MAG: non-homologous end-joining DNA ligase [Gammaproteobacteria bacterium]
MTARTIGNRTIEVSREDKLFFPDDGITKGDVVDYFAAIAPVMLPHAKRRCLTLHRFPDGIDGDDFYQQSRPDYFPGWVDGFDAPTAEPGQNVEHVVCDNQACLVYLASQAAFVLHSWLATVDEPDCPDRMVFDLDPAGKGEDFTPVRQAARRLHELLEEIECPSFLMTTGSRGLHVVVPLDSSVDFDRSREVASAVAGHLAARYPEELTTAHRKNKRRGRLYLDVMRNARGQTSVVPYSLRARPGAPVATPLDWDELSRSRLGPRYYHLGNIRRRLAQRDDPWKGMGRRAVSAEKVAERLDDLED